MVDLSGWNTLQHPATHCTTLQHSATGALQGGHAQKEEMISLKRFQKLLSNMMRVCVCERVGVNESERVCV